MSRSDIGDWMPFDGNDFYGSETVALGEAETEAAYMRLLWYQWLNGSLPVDSKLLRELLPAKFHKRWARTWAALECKFPVVVVDGVTRRANDRCDADREHARLVTEKRRKGAATTNASRWKGPSESLDVEVERVAERHGERSQCESLSDTVSDRSASRSSVAERSTSTRTETETSQRTTPPTPPPGGDGARAAAGEGVVDPPKGGRRKARPVKAPEAWESVLQRPEYRVLRESDAFAERWAEWIAACAEPAKSGRARTVPAGSRAAEMFNQALRAGPERYCEAIALAIRQGYEGVDVAYLPGGGGGGGHRTNGHALGGELRGQAQNDSAAEFARNRLAALGLEREEPRAAEFEERIGGAA